MAESPRDEFYSTANILLAPIRWLLIVGKYGAIFLFVIFFAGFNCLGWIVGCGVNSTASRIKFAQNARGGNESKPLDVYFDGPDDPYGWNKPGSDSYNEGDYNDGYSHWCLAWRDSRSFNGTNDTPEMGIDTEAIRWRIVTHPGVNFLDEDSKWMERKEARIRFAIATAKNNIDDLRIALSEFKSGPRRERLYDCANNNRDTSVRHLDLHGAPRIKVSYGEQGLCDLNDGNETDCSSALEIYVTKYDDLFAKYAPLSPDQLLAEKVLYETGNKEFWLRMAHQNHIYNDDYALGYWAKHDRSAPEWVQ